MDKKVLIGIAVVVIALLGIGGVLVLSKKSPATSNTTPIGIKETSVPSATQSLKDLLATGTSQQCSFNISDTNSGKVYVSGGKVRGDFSVTADGNVMNTHMIGDGVTSYLWIDGQTSGFKMSFEPSTSANPSASAGASQSVDVEKKMDYKCTPWLADSNLFTVPTNITFTDMSAIKTGTTVNGGTTDVDTKQQQCAACDSAPESSRTQCRAALGCN